LIFSGGRIYWNYLETAPVYRQNSNGETMNKSTGITLRLAVFIYDCMRLFFLLTLLMIFTGNADGNVGMFQGAPAWRFPYMVYAAPNALFPLMSLFLLLRFAESRAFLPLYMTGKLISVAALAGWMVAVIIEGRNLYAARWSLFLGAADLASAVGAILLRTAETAAPAAGSGQSRAAPAETDETLLSSGGEQ
jgi:hypothetical protein